MARSCICQKKSLVKCDKIRSEVRYDQEAGRKAVFSSVQLVSRTPLLLRSVSSLGKPHEGTTACDERMAHSLGMNDAREKRLLQDLAFVSNLCDWFCGSTLTVPFSCGYTDSFVWPLTGESLCWQGHRQFRRELRRCWGDHTQVFLRIVFLLPFGYAVMGRVFLSAEKA